MNTGELTCKTGMGAEYTGEDIFTFDDKDDLWMEQLSVRGMYDEEEDDRKCLGYMEDDMKSIKSKEDDRNVVEDDLGEEDELWMSQLYTDNDYSLLDTPTTTPCNKRMVTNLRGWSVGASPGECLLSEEDSSVVPQLGTTERVEEPIQLIEISRDGPFVADHVTGGEEWLSSGSGHEDNTSNDRELHQDGVKLPGWPGDKAVITSMLVPTKVLVEPSMDNVGNSPGKHHLLSVIDFDNAEIQASIKKDDQECKIQVLHQQPPSLIVDDRNQEDTPDPEPSTTPREEDDQEERQEDTKVMDADAGQVLRQHQEPPHQEPTPTSVPGTKLKGANKNMFISIRGVPLSSPGGRRGVQRKGECQHKRGGYCLLHGEGAAKKTRLVSKTTEGPGGKMLKKMVRQTYYECNEDNRRGETLRQSQLSFITTKKTIEPVGEDTTGEQDSFTFSLSTISEGQNGADMSVLPGTEM